MLWRFLRSQIRKESAESTRSEMNEVGQGGSKRKSSAINCQEVLLPLAIGRPMTRWLQLYVRQTPAHVRELCRVANDQGFGSSRPGGSMPKGFRVALFVSRIASLPASRIERCLLPVQFDELQTPESVLQSSWLTRVERSSQPDGFVDRIDSWNCNGLHRTMFVAEIRRRH